MIFKNLPALMTLTASLIALIITYVYRYNVTKALVVVLVSAVVFFISGLMVRSLLNHFLVVETEETEEEGEPAEEDDEEDEEEY